MRSGDALLSEPRTKRATGFAIPRYSRLFNGVIQPSCPRILWITRWITCADGGPAPATSTFEEIAHFSIKTRKSIFFNRLRPLHQSRLEGKQPSVHGAARPRPVCITFRVARVSAHSPSARLIMPLRANAPAGPCTPPQSLVRCSGRRTHHHQPDLRHVLDGKANALAAEAALLNAAVGHVVHPV